MLNAVGALDQGLSGFQAAGQLRSDPRVMAIAIRAAIEAASPPLASDPEFDIDNSSREVVTVFDLATRIGAWP